MREILFRGKRIDNGKWYYGSYLFIKTCPEDWTGQKNGREKEVHYIINEFDINYAVEDKTISQYTGLKDKNGNRVFEGDILRISKISDSIGSYYFPPLKYPYNVFVKWDYCAWIWEVIGKDKYYISFPDAWCHYECEVIGNIHDNPELLSSSIN